MQKESADKSTAWWMSYPKIESRKLKRNPLFAKPELEVGQYVFLTGKLDRPREILETEWHAHRYEFVYIVETSAQHFKPYWFRDKLVLQK
jgi:hypothetical protein